MITPSYIEEQTLTAYHGVPLDLLDESSIEVGRDDSPFALLVKDRRPRLSRPVLPRPLPPQPCSPRPTRRRHRAAPERGYGRTSLTI